MNLNNITNSQLFVSLMAFLTANLGTVIVLAINLIKSKVKNINLTEKITKLIAEHDIEIGNKITYKMNEIENKIDSKVDNMCAKVEARLKLDSDEKRQAVEDNAQQIDTLIKETQALLNEGADE